MQEGRAIIPSAAPLPLTPSPEPADKAAGMPPNVGKASGGPSERAAEEPESVEGMGADEVMERRMNDPEIGGYAT